MKKLLLLFLLLIPVSASAFSDLPEDHKYYSNTMYLQYEDAVGGYDDGTVKPDEIVNRAELLKILVEGQDIDPGDGSNCFPDVEEEWFAQYVCYALDQGWVDGYDDGTFQPSKDVNKVESLKIIFNAFGLDIADGAESFDDVDKDDWYSPFVKTGLDKGLLEEEGNSSFGSSEDRTRGQVFEVVARIMQIRYMDDPAYNDQIGAEFYTFMLLNKIREEYGVTEDLKLNADLTRAARAHSLDMLNNVKGLSHQGSDGSQSHDRIRAEVSGNVGTGENIGSGTISFRSLTDVVDAVHVLFMEEPDECHNHRTTILSKCFRFTDVGIGVAVGDNQIYFTEDFVFFTD